MIEIFGKPFLYYQINNLKLHGISNILLCVGYLKEHIVNYFRDGRKFGVKIIYSMEDTPLHTGGALKKAQSKIDDDFLLLNGDTYVPLNYSKIFHSLNKNKIIGIMVVYNNDSQFMVNNVQVDEEGHVIDYNKKKSNPQMNGVDAGVYCFNKGICSYFPNKNVFMMEEEVFPNIIKERQLLAYQIDDRFYDIGTPLRYEAFKKYMLVNSL